MQASNASSSGLNTQPLRKGVQLSSREGRFFLADTREQQEYYKDLFKQAGITEIIDTHAYFGRNDTCQREATVDDFRNLQEQVKGAYGVNVRFLIMPLHLGYNNSLATIARNNADVFAGAIPIVYPQTGDKQRDTAYTGFAGYTPSGKLAKILEEEKPGIVGAKINTGAFRIPLDHESYDPFFAALAGHPDITIVHHCPSKGDEYMSIQRLLALEQRLKAKGIIESTIPNRTVLAHLGGLEQSCLNQALAFMKERGDMHLNTTGMCGFETKLGRPYAKEDETPSDTYAPLVKAAMAQTHGDRVVFGSDIGFFRGYSFHPLSTAQEHLTPEQLKGLLYTNATKTFPKLLPRK